MTRQPQHTPKGDNGNTAPPQRPSLPPESITGGGDPRSMVPVRLAGAEVSAGFLIS